MWPSMDTCDQAWVSSHILVTHHGPIYTFCRRTSVCLFNKHTWVFSRLLEAPLWGRSSVFFCSPQVVGGGTAMKEMRRGFAWKHCCGMLGGGLSFRGPRRKMVWCGKLCNVIFYLRYKRGRVTSTYDLFIYFLLHNIPNLKMFVSFSLSVMGNCFYQNSILLFPQAKYSFHRYAK